MERENEGCEHTKRELGGSGKGLFLGIQEKLKHVGQVTFIPDFGWINEGFQRILHGHGHKLGRKDVIVCPKPKFLVG